MLFKKYTELLNLEKPISNALKATRVSERDEIWIAIDRQSCPILLVSSEEGYSESDLRLNAIDVQFARSCQIQIEHEGYQTGVFTAVKLIDDDTDQAQLFLRLLEVSFIESGVVLSNSTIRKEILRLADLFRRAEDGRNDLIGLWGELHIIHQADDIENAVSSWCSHPKSKFDFVCSDFGLEIKATLKPARIHRFSLDQLRPQSEIPLYVASLMLIEKPSGMSVGSLIDEVSASLPDPNLRAAFIKQCVLKGGKGVYQSELKLDCLPQGKSVCVYEATSIPVPNVDSRQPISNVKFDVDLTESEGLPEEDSRKFTGFSSS